jgi:probable O-glycosylation ligase (exosortase A-associated)
MITGVLIVIAVGAVAAIMPQAWYDRMYTIADYEHDASAMGRINAWWFAWNLAKARPLTGGGFETFTPSLFSIYAPNPRQYHDVHSIYFEVLGEHGFVGLVLFLALGFMAWRTATLVAKRARQSPELKWLADLVTMVQVSLIGYAAGGAFLGLAYFDLAYHLVAMIVIAKGLLLARERELAQTAGEQGKPGPDPPPPGFGRGASGVQPAWRRGQRLPARS